MNYTNGKIYTIKNKNDTSLIYVGSTIQTLEERFRQHKKDCIKKTQYPNHKLYTRIEDWNDWYIELYENCSCNSKKELCKREGEIIREIGTLNRCIAGRTDKEYRLDNDIKIKEQKKQRYLNNKEKRLEQKKQHYLDNKDKILEQQKQHYLDKKEKISEYKKKYYLDNKNKISEYKKKYYLDNKNKISEQQKQWYLNNKEQQKQYYLDNASKIKEQKKNYRLKKKNELLSKTSLP